MLMWGTSVISELQRPLFPKDMIFRGDTETHRRQAGRTKGVRSVALPCRRFAG